MQIDANQGKKIPIFQSGDEIRLGWYLVWFVPLSILILFTVERHTIPFGLTAIKLVIKRWNWSGLFSPSAAICFATVAGSIIYPAYGLIAALALLGNGCDTRKRRYLYAAVILAIVAVLPIITDTLIWGSFPFTFDSRGVGHLRVIPFLPWPSGGYMAF